MYFEITAPAYCIEHEHGASVTLEGKVTKEIDIEMPNPNLDCYLVGNDWMEDYSRVRIQGRAWELDLREAEITLELSEKEIRDSAKLRADEDHCLEHEVLNQWASWNKHDSLERRFNNAMNEIMTGEPTPSA